jgi:hypothetical protein
VAISSTTIIDQHTCPEITIILAEIQIIAIITIIANPEVQSVLIAAR